MNRDTIFCTYPASILHELWKEALVSGNGQLGASVYGGNQEETTMITRSDLWFGGMKSDLPEVSSKVSLMRQLMKEEKFTEANCLLTDALKEEGYSGKLDSFLPLGDLKVTFSNGQGFKNYQRGIHLDTGEVFATWEEKKQKFSSKLFVSRKDDVIVKEISGENLNLSIQLDYHQSLKTQRTPEIIDFIFQSKKCEVADNYLSYFAQNTDGTFFGAVGKISTDGKIFTEENILKVNNAQKVFITLKTFARKKDADKEKENLKKEISHALSYETFFKEHVLLHEALYRSCALKLDWNKAHSNENLLLNAYEEKLSPELIEKIWRFGRYLFISGTSPEALPFPLYGLWGGDYRLMWGHNMANVNIQMIYWHSLVGNLTDFHKSFCQYYVNKIPQLKENARKIWGMKGIYLPAGTTPNMSLPTQVVPVIINWVHAAGWICQHFYKYSEYLEDKEYFLKEFSPFMKETANFYEEFITWDEKGQVQLVPSVSPENSPKNFIPKDDPHMAHPMPTTINSTIDIAITKELFTNLLSLGKETNQWMDKWENWGKIIQGLPDYEVSKDGGIREWQNDLFEERYEHRHLSHLYPVFPGAEVDNLHEKDLLPLFQKAAELRKVETQTGWSLAYLANLYARFEQGEKAEDTLLTITKSVLLNNFFTLHNDWRKMNTTLTLESSPVQLDALLGSVSAIQEMLFYTGDHFIKLLPALSEALFCGEFKNFSFPKGTISLKWDVKNKTLSGLISSCSKQKITIQLPKFISINNLKIEEKNCTVTWNKNYLEVIFEKNGRLKINCQ